MARKKSKANYFTAETEEYIKKYNISTDIEYRNKIFTDHIYYPFYKLVENIIHTFKFYYTDVEQIEDLKHEVVTVLLEEKIMKFDPTNGAKAYSYFGTIVKRWLINYNNKNYKKLLQNESTPDSFALNVPSYMIVGDPELDYEGAISLGTYIDIWVSQTYVKLDELFLKDSEKRIADAILTIFKKRSDLEIFKKKALYIYIREMTDCETPQLTRVISTLKKNFYEGYLELYDRGVLVPNLNNK
tara:strand:+ start:389 stop:1117 length:729 start_codon:yes stop_codon:yes gene_type:complete